MIAKLIAIEGTDGSGKATQAKLLVESLKREGHEVGYYDFPQYGKPSAYFVERYLRDEYPRGYTGAYPASLFYALDRYEAAIKIRQDLEVGKTVVLNRSTASSMAHLGGKISDPKERHRFWEWLREVEHIHLGIPRPEQTLVLHVPAKIAARLIQERGKPNDIHEVDAFHLEMAEAAYLEMCKKFDDFELVNCVKDGELLSIPEAGGWFGPELLPK